MSTEENNIPEGFRKNAKGHLIPLDQISERDLLCDQLVTELTEQAKKLSGTVLQFRNSSLDETQAFVQLSGEKYNAKIGGRKGNVTLFSFDGRYKMTRKVADCLQFDERLQAAKALIDECLNEWSKDGNPNIRTVIQSAFETDAKGNVATHKILELRSIKIKDEKWESAMDAISDAINVVGNKVYICFYERDQYGKYHQITIDPNKV